ncbi:MAG: Wzz/FepE/Etk N-terminal domain-containing protein [Candidatus Edwardsbacteria bacterium]|nr:Wzz/FepE/Etk N-terminal domain-containing protein [Candidatus Edwardsbacteria bacterium]
MINSFYDLLYILVKNRRTIIWITAGFTVFALLLSLLIPKKYKATATLMPPASQSMSLMSLAFKAGMPSDPEVGGVGFMPGMMTPSDIFGFMLKNGAVTGRVIDQCALVKHYKKDKQWAKDPGKAMYNVNKKLDKATAIKVTEERFITVTVEDKSADKAAEVANCYGDVLNSIYSGLNMSQGQRAREFIENRVAQEEVLLREMEDSLRVFQKRFRTVSITEEMKALIEMSAKIEADIMTKRIELEALKSYNTKDNSQIKILTTEIDKAEQQLNNLMVGGKDKTLFIPFAKAPDIGAELTRRMRAVKIHQEVYALLVEQLEHAKILEAKDTPKIQFLERASPPWKKSWPKKSIIVILGFFCGLLISIIYSILIGWIEWVKTDKEMIGKINSILNLFIKNS